MIIVRHLLAVVLPLAAFFVLAVATFLTWLAWPTRRLQERIVVYCHCWFVAICVATALLLLSWWWRLVP